MNGTWVFRAACATVRNCSGLSKFAAAISGLAPGLRTAFTRSRNSGRHAETAIVSIVFDSFLFTALTAVTSCVRDDDARACCETRAVAGDDALVSTARAGDACIFLQFFSIVGPVAAPTTTAPTRAAVIRPALATVMSHPPWQSRVMRPALKM